MSEATITITLDKDVAEKYNTASDEERQKMNLLIRLFLEDMMVSDTRSAQEILNAIGYEAQRRGLTPEVLDQLLHKDE
ncbi:MAG: hypothetical protein HC828_09625 [Blastochloris sp.]|nr:hypothetical protein [Blastochloris sp.]